MNENIGVKGTGKDYRRSLIIKKQKLDKIKKLKELDDIGLKELEKKVRILQIITFLKVIPLIITTTVFKTLATDNLTKKENNQHKSSASEKKEPKLEESLPIEKEILFIEQSDIEKENTTDKEDLTIHKNIEETKEENKNNNTVPKIDKQNISKTIIPSILIEKVNVEIKKIDNIKDKKIIKTYENKLKDTKKDLEFIANDIDDEKIYFEIEKMISKVNIVLKKLESLNNKINVNQNDYDKENIYFLIEEYTKEFKNNRIIDDIKDSNLYISLSLKLDELEKEKDRIKNKVKLFSTKEKEENKTEDVFNFKKVNQEFNKFQNQENQIAESFLEKTKQENDKQNSNDYLEQKVKTLNKEAKALTNFAKKEEFVGSSIRNTKIILTAILTNIFFMKNILNNRIFKRKRKQLKRINYNKVIEKSSTSITNILNLLKLTTNKIDNLISDIKSNINKYNSNEYQQLLQELENIKRTLKEKEIELEKKVKNKQKIMIK